MTFNNEQICYVVEDCDSCETTKIYATVEKAKLGILKDYLDLIDKTGDITIEDVKVDLKDLYYYGYIPDFRTIQEAVMDE